MGGLLKNATHFLIQKAMNTKFRLKTYNFRVLALKRVAFLLALPRGEELGRGFYSIVC